MKTYDHLLFFRQSGRRAETINGVTLFLNCGNGVAAAAWHTPATSVIDLKVLLSCDHSRMALSSSMRSEATSTSVHHDSAAISPTLRASQMRFPC